MQSIIIINLHDHKIGLPRGQGGPRIRLAEDDPPTYAVVAVAQPSEQPLAPSKPTADDSTAPGGALDAVKGGKQANGKGKGYGQCWHRGQMGRPRRECPEWFKLQNGTGNVAASKGGEWQNNKGKGKKGKGEKGGKGQGWINNWRPPGKSVGKSSNCSGSGDYHNAWGWVGYPDLCINCSNYCANSYIGNAIVMLEVGREIEQTDNDDNEQRGDKTNHDDTMTEQPNRSLTRIFGERNPSLNGARRKTVELGNSFTTLEYDAGGDDDIGGNVIDECNDYDQGHNHTIAHPHNHKTHPPNQRQRRRRRQQFRLQSFNDDSVDD